MHYKNEKLTLNILSVSIVCYDVMTILYLNETRHEKDAHKVRSTRKIVHVNYIFRAYLDVVFFCHVFR